MATPLPIQSPLRHLDPRAVSLAARAEARNRETRLPPISVFRWWARRTDAIFGGIIEALQQDRDGDLMIADPFAGGGVIPLAALARGCRVYAQEIDPWAANGIAAMLSLPSPVDFQRAREQFAARADKVATQAYGTVGSDGLPAMISHTFRVAEAACSACQRVGALYPSALVTLLARVERGRSEAFLACPAGHLFRGHRKNVQVCPECSLRTDPEAAYTERRRITCPCGATESLAERASKAGLTWRVVLVERILSSGRREIDIPTPAEIVQAEGSRWKPTRDLGEIPRGQETRVLLRHGLKSWNDLYPARQRVVLERLLALAPNAKQDPTVARLIRLAVVGTAEMAGHASRWDRFYLKSYEAMANHRFNFTTFSAEPNVCGTESAGRGTVLRRLRLFERACQWLRSRCATPKIVGPVSSRKGRRKVSGWQGLVVEGSSERMLLPAKSCDAVVTDPPYHDDVQYGELSLPLRSWAGLDLAEPFGGNAVVNRATGENTSTGAYRDLLTRIFSEAHRVLQDDGHLILSYANREPAAWVALFEALDAAGFRAVGYTILHSENDTDFAKRGVAACNHDLLMDLVPKSLLPIEQFAPDGAWELTEQRFLAFVGARFLSIGESQGPWQEGFVEALRDSEFLGNPPPETGNRRAGRSVG